MYIQVKNADETHVRKAQFILKSKGSNLAQAVRDMVADLAKEFDENQGKEN